MPLSNLMRPWIAGCAAAFAATTMAKDPYGKPDDTWISLSGTVDALSEHAFTLDYGDGIVTVEMDDRDRDADAYQLRKGDKVTVSGLIDAEVFEAASIEASSVYVENIGTRFYASPRDEEAIVDYSVTPVTRAYTSVLQGTVTEVGDTSFTLNTGDRRIEVNVSDLDYDPLDDEGYQQVTPGDSVQVTGYADTQLFEGRVFVAETLVTNVGQ